MNGEQTCLVGIFVGVRVKVVSVGDSVGVLVLDGDIRIFCVGVIYVDLVTTISSCEIPQAAIRMRLKVTQYNRSSFTVSLATLHSLSSDYYRAT